MEGVAGCRPTWMTRARRVFLGLLPADQSQRPRSCACLLVPASGPPRFQSLPVCRRGSMEDPVFAATENALLCRRSSWDSLVLRHGDQALTRDYRLVLVTCRCPDGRRPPNVHLRACGLEARGAAVVYLLQLGAVGGHTALDVDSFGRRTPEAVLEDVHQAVCLMRVGPQLLLEE